MISSPPTGGAPYASRYQAPLQAPAGGGVATARGSSTPRRLTTSALALAVGCVAVTAVGLMLGSRALPLSDVLAALAGQDRGDASIIVWDQRLPRTLLGLLVGAALGIGGAVAQGLTRNALADPGLLGVSAGAALAIVIGTFTFGITALAPQLALGILGASAAGAAVLLLGTRSSLAATPQGFALIGVAVSAILGSIASTLVLLDADTLDEYRFWLVGSLAGRGTSTLTTVAPVILVGIVLALACSRLLDALALGDDAAQALGVGLRRARLLAGAAVLVLTGAAVAAAGPIAFVGLAVPHAARTLSGPRASWLLPFSGALGAVLLVTADILGRIISRPSELQAGVVSALVGAPVALLLIGRARSAGPA
jgi:iron complex transport system permease protein